MAVWDPWWKEPDRDAPPPGWVPTDDWALDLLRGTGRLNPRGQTPGSWGSALNPSQMSAGGGANPLAAAGTAIGGANLVRGGVNLAKDIGRGGSQAVPPLPPVTSILGGAPPAAGALDAFGYGPGLTATPSGAAIAAGGGAPAAFGPGSAAELGLTGAGEAGAGFLGALAPWFGPLAIGLGGAMAILNDRTNFNQGKDAQRNQFAAMGETGAYNHIASRLDEAARTGAGLQTDYTQWIDSFKDVFRNPTLVAQLQAKQDQNARDAERFFGFGQAMGDVGGAVTGAKHDLPGGYAYEPAEERSESGGVPRYNVTETGAPKEELSPADIDRFTAMFGGEGNIYNAGHERTPTGYRRRPLAIDSGGGGNA